MDLKQLIELCPEFHQDAQGDPISWGIAWDVLRFLENRLAKGSKTLETGAGVSTVLFAASGCSHISITPVAREIATIREFCERHGIDMSHVQLLEQRSEYALPALYLDDLDVVLIDGRHAFPSPFVDWFYGADALKMGGWMVVDDTHLLTGTILRDFMNEDHNNWRLIADVGNTTFFEKLVATVHLGEWTEQPYILNRMP